LQRQETAHVKSSTFPRALEASSQLDQWTQLKHDLDSATMAQLPQTDLHMIACSSSPAVKTRSPVDLLNTSGPQNTVKELERDVFFRGLRFRRDRVDALFGYAFA